MARRIEDSDEAARLRGSGSIGFGFNDIGSETTSSLGLSGSINTYTASLVEVTNDSTSSYDFSNIENSIKFLTAKVYENRESVQKIFTGDQTYTGNITVNETIRGSISGNSATTSETTITSGQASAITANTAKTGITNGQASAISANTAKVTNSDQTKADINALDITEVGTISSGVWQGTTIKTDYIGDDQVTEAKLANSLLAEIDANTAKVTNANQDLSSLALKTKISGSFVAPSASFSTRVTLNDAKVSNADQDLSGLAPKANPTFTGAPLAPTQTAGNDSTRIATTAYVQQELTDLIGTAPATLDTLGELSASLASDQTGLASLTTTVSGKSPTAGNTSLTTVGTIGTGVWQGTTIKTAYIGDDQITEAKLANSLLAEIDANTAKVTNSDQDLSSLALKTKISGSFIIPSASFSTRVTLNDAKVTNSDQSKSDIDGLGITTVGTIDTGVWQGTTIKTAYIGDDQITEAKLANSLLAEIDANTAKVTNADQDLSSLALKTKISGSFVIPSASFSTRVTLNDAKVTNADQSKADINALDITEVGTISSGVWQGTTIKTAYIGDDQITEAKLANSLLAEIDANTAKVTNADQDLSSLALKTKISGSFVIPSASFSTRVTLNDAKVTNSDQTDAEIRAAVEAASNSNVFTDADHSKLNGIEASATADQTAAQLRSAIGTGNGNLVPAAGGSGTFLKGDGTFGTPSYTTNTNTQLNNDQVKAAVEAASDSNTFTDADHSKLNGIEASATADQTAAQIKTLVGTGNSKFVPAAGTSGHFLKHDGSFGIPAYTTNTNTTYSVQDGELSQNNFTNADHSKLNGIEASATADQSNAEIRTAVEAATDSNVFTDADHSKLNGIEASATADQTVTNSISTTSSTTVASATAVKAAYDRGSTGITNAAAAAQTANGALPKAGGTMSGAIAMGTSKITGMGNPTANQDAATKAYVDGAVIANTDTQNLSISGQTLSLQNGGSVTLPDTNTTYSVQDGELSQNNFTNADHSKLDGIATNANNSTANATHTGDVTGATALTIKTSVALAGNPTTTTQAANNNSTRIATTAYVQQELTDLIGTAPATLDTLGELSASLASDQSGLASLTSTVGTKLAKSSNLSDLANAGTARSNLGLGNAAVEAASSFATSGQGTKADAALPKAGGTMTGKITLDGAPSSNLHAATKAYVDGAVIANTDTQNLSISGQTLSLQNGGSVTLPDTNTTYSVGDGELSQNNFTNADHSKLDGIEASATADQSNAEILTAIEDGVDSVHYVDGSIDTVHIGDDQVTAAKLANSINSAIAANTAKVTNSNQSKADINALDITEVGTISSGVWQGTTIKTAYIGDDQVTEDKLANSLLAEIDANTAKVGTTSTERSRIAANHAKVGITATQADRITANHAKVGISTSQASAITANTNKTGISNSQASAISANTSKTGITSGQASAITANTAKVTNSDQTKADINALDITEVGTISSGVWQGTTIKTAYIGDDQITEAKLANTLLAEIDANTAKVTNSDQSKADINALDITEVGTISSGVWQGTTIKTAYIGDDQVTEAKLANSLLAEIDANTAKVSNRDPNRANINALDITEVGTISSGVWNGTAITTDYIATDAITEDKLANSLLAEIDANTSKTGITTSQASAISANTSKTGITTSQASAISANTSKTGITTSQASAITANTNKTGITSGQASAITANTAKVGTETDLSITEGMDVKMTVNRSEAGAYSITFTLTHGRVRKTAIVNLS